MSIRPLDAMRLALVSGLLAGACSVPSAPAEQPEPEPRRLPESEPERQPTRSSLPPSDRLCTADCCPRDTTVVHVGSATAARPSTTHACLVGDAQANELTAGPRGDVIFAGAGNDIVRGGPTRDTILGDDGDDEIHAGLGSDHVDGGFGADRIEGGEHSDLILGGPDDDVIHGDENDEASERFGADVIYGGSGSDTIDGGMGEDQVLGGVGNDELRGGRSNDLLLGGRGNDTIDGGHEDDIIQGEAGDDIIHGGEGADTIKPGLGRDEAYGEEGDDTFILLSECGLAAGEIVDGGPGYDRVFSPWTEAELIERGIRVTSIESFTDPRLTRDKECVLDDERPEMIEVSGTVVATETMFLDDRGTPRPPDGRFHSEWQIITKHAVTIDTVYLGGIEVGETIHVLLPGGRIELPDGTGRGASGCCFRELHEGRRYRMELREALDDQGVAVGWDYIWYPTTTIHHALVLPLGARGPVSLAAAWPREEVEFACYVHQWEQGGVSCNAHNACPRGQACVPGEQVDPSLPPGVNRCTSFCDDLGDGCVDGRRCEPWPDGTPDGHPTVGACGGAMIR